MLGTTQSLSTELYEDQADGRPANREVGGQGALRRKPATGGSSPLAISSRMGLLNLARDTAGHSIRLLTPLVRAPL
jgi:hypothetical protein